MAKILIFIAIIAISIFLRFYKLETLPIGFYVDEAVQGYNAFSIAQTGKDEYGMAFPILLRGLGTFGTSLYTHLSAMAILLFGPTIFAIRFWSTFSGVAIVILTFLITYQFFGKNFSKALLPTIVVATAPWAIFLSRGVDEPNLGLVFLLLGVYFSFFSISKIFLFPVAIIFLAISTYGYTAERVVSTLFLFGFIFIFKKHFLHSKKILSLSLALFFLLLLPQIILLFSTGGTIRLTGQSYFGQGNFVREFFSQYSAYFSPRNLFFDPDPDLQRSIPDLSVFYVWMVIPFFIGLKVFFTKLNEPYIKALLLLLLISPIPAALTKDPFSTFRNLPSFWVISIIIGFGIYHGFSIIKQFPVKIVVSILIVFFTTISLYSSYFVLFNFERAKNWDFAYKELAKISIQQKDTHFVIETSRGSPPHILLLFYTLYDPIKMQQYNASIINNYYEASEFSRNYKFGNIETRQIFWEKDIYQEQVLVGDPLSISENQAKEHSLTLQFEIKDLRDEVLLKGYSTKPR